VFDEPSPLSAPETVASRMHADRPGALPADDAVKEVSYDLANESFDVIIPGNYRPAAPHGLLVWMGVTDFSSHWLDTLTRHKLIYVGPNKVAGAGFGRLGLPLDGVHNLK